MYATPFQGPPFKTKNCFQRKDCISDFVKWYSYISSDFVNCFQCNVWVSTICLKMAVKPFFMFNCSLNVSIIIDDVVDKHTKCTYSAFLVLGCKKCRFERLEVHQPAYTQKRSTIWCQRCTKPAYTQKKIWREKTTKPAYIIFWLYAGCFALLASECWSFLSICRLCGL